MPSRRDAEERKRRGSGEGTEQGWTKKVHKVRCQGSAKAQVAV